MRLKDKVILISASTRGIDHACVKACAKEGAIIYMAARDLDRGHEAAEQLCAAGGRVKCVYNDATKKMGKGSILINLSGRGDKDMDYIIEKYGIR